MNARKRLTGSLIALLCGLLAEPAQARSHATRLLNGTVRAIDVERHLLVIDPQANGARMEIQIREGQTHLTSDGQRASLADLTVGQPVRLSYRRVLGQDVATDIYWETPASDGKSKSPDLPPRER